MTERDKLIFYLTNANAAYKKDMPCSKEEFTADFILAAGVILPPVKVGDTVFIIDAYHNEGKQVYETKVFGVEEYTGRRATQVTIYIDAPWNPRVFESRDANEIYLTREEAEKALAELKERESNGSN